MVKYWSILVLIHRKITSYPPSSEDIPIFVHLEGSFLRLSEK